ncbi:thiol reductant ABC exporter subunit CydD [Azoarcus sp. TTM-91]|uniref:thiol reductant ABC exporter subunit CydD n=1 Tax=Azoarcus sp. TTM-91 TaxID=2691581 RepID=UPI00145F2527|nr:thiol reductant ABC exporter subunit CydD [Azoarcus sp. TTM-91]NMG34035.1 thiol reductant ABC exporter subunit CydD [Azoarcus sp. TTM-91]
MDSGSDMSEAERSADRRGQDAAALRWLRLQARGAGAWGAAAVLGGGLQVLAAIAQAGVLAWMLHMLIVEGGNPFAQPAAWWALPACLLARALTGVLKEEAGQRASERIRGRLREALLDRLHHLGPAWRERRQAGALADLLLEQVEAVEGYYARYRPQQWLALLAPLFILAAVLPQSWAAAGILFLTAPLIPLFMVLVGWGARARQTRQLLALQRMSGHFLDLLRGLPTLRLLDAHERQAQEVARIGEDFRQRTMSVLRLAFLSGTVLEFFASVAIALTAVYLGFSLLGYLDFGFYGAAPELRLAFFILLLAPEFYQPLRDLGTHYHARAEALAAAGQLQAMLDAPSPQPAGGKRTLPPGAPALRLSGLMFAHREGEPVLQGCELELAAGEAVAIVGPSGGGKTTLLRLLLGQLQPQAGELVASDVPFTELDLQHWRERIGWMSQHPRLLAGSLADNLRLARQGADAAAMIEALHFAGLGDWLATLPQGLDTVLGEGGRQLSGGQLRRLALARVRLRPADLLLLDEPTASLDHDTEALVVERLAELRRNRTVLLLSHRRAPLRLADRVLRLDGGRLQPASPAEFEGEGG